MVSSYSYFNEMYAVQWLIKGFSFACNAFVSPRLGDALSYSHSIAMAANFKMGLPLKGSLCLAE